MEKFRMRRRASYIFAVTLGALGLAFVLFLAPSASAAPATVFTVDSTLDEVDDAIGSGGCHTASGVCTLRAAIQEANFAGGAHGIILPTGTITLTIAGILEDNSATGDLDIKSDLTITGTGSATTIIDGGGLDRVFHVIGGGPPIYIVTISGVTIRNGSASGALGGGFKIEYSALTLNGVVVNANAADVAGGIYVAGSNATLLVNNSFISNNTGGGIYSNSGATSIISSTLNGNSATSQAGGIEMAGAQLTINSSSMYSNSASGFGGAIRSNSTTNINSSSIYSNTAPTGGAIASSGTLNISNSNLYRNSAALTSAAIHNTGTTNITNTNIYSNTSTGNAGGISNSNLMNIVSSAIYSNTGGAGSQGGGFYNSGTLNLTTTKVYSNVASFGGGMYNFAGVVSIISSTLRYNNALDGGAFYSNLNLSGKNSATVLNSTISNNTASGANPNGLGGGIVAGTSVTLTNVTVSGNSARIGGGLWMSPGTTQTISLNNTTITLNTATESSGGYLSGGNTNNVKNSIIAKNTANSGSPDCGGDAITSQGYNILGKNTGCTFFGTTGDQIGTGGSPIDPKLGPLANVGGPSAVHLLLSGSPAIDTGNPAAPGSGGDACAAIDQRGFVRPIGAQCDIGAFEGTGAGLYLPLIMR